MNPVPGWCFAPRIIALAAVAAVCSAWGADWPVSSEGLKPDPRWHWGRLDNGLRYVVRSNPLPAGCVSYRFVVEVGAAHESREEAGLSHFIEHMAHNGTRNFKGETLGREMGKRGIAWGPESNAFTFLTHTIYQVDAPGNSAADVDWMMTVIRDIADGVEFEPGQVKREEGVIVSEERDGNTLGRRFEAARRADLYKGSPLGTEFKLVPTTVSPAELKKFYQKWYRADRMILAVVGDAPVEVLEAAIRGKFSSLPAPSGPEPAFDPAPLENPPVGTCRVVHDPKAVGLHLEVVSVMPRTNADTLEERRRLLAAQFACFILNQRLVEDVRKSPSAFSGGSAQVFAPNPFSCEALVQMQTSSADVRQAVEVLDRELRQSFQFTFHPDEIAVVRQRYMRDIEDWSKGSVSAQSRDLAGLVVQEAVWRTVSTSPEDMLAFARSVGPGITGSEINKAWRSFWQEHRARIFGFGYYPVAGGEAYILREFNLLSDTPVAKPADPAKLDFPYTDFGPAGELKRRSHVDSVDMDLLEFSNGVKVNLKHTDFEANRVGVFFRMGSGMQGEPRNVPGLVRLASGALVGGGLKKLSPEELSRIYAIEPVQLQFVPREAEFDFIGSSSPENAERLLQLMCAYLVDARWDRSAFTSAGTMLAGAHTEYSNSAEGVLGMTGMSFLANGDSRYRMDSPAELSRIGLIDVREWLDPILRGAPMEVGIVGDFNVEELVPVIARTLGALPQRDAQQSAAPPVVFRSGPGRQVVKIDRKSPKAAIQIAWPTGADPNIRRLRQLEVVAEIMRNRLIQRVREDAGETYSPDGSYWRSDIGWQAGFILARVLTSPKARSRVERAILREADDLAKKGVGEEEFRQAITPVTERTRTQLRENVYWLYHIAPHAQSNPDVLNWPATRVSDFETTNRDEINKLLREILPSKKAMTMIVSP